MGGRFLTRRGRFDEAAVKKYLGSGRRCGAHLHALASRFARRLSRSIGRVRNYC